MTTAIDPNVSFSAEVADQRRGRDDHNDCEAASPTLSGPLGLTDHARLLPGVLEKARSLERDRPSHAMALERVAAKPEFGPAQAARAEVAFLQFALLCAVTDEPVSPSGLADEYWHEFILHTKAYARWCKRHFGRFLHHRPESRRALEKRGVVQRSQALYRTYFDYDRSLATCHPSCSNH